MRKPNQRIGSGQLLWLISALLVVVAPHLLRLPKWIAGAFILCVLWRWRRATQQSAKNHYSLLGRLSKQALTVGSLGLVYAHYGTLLGRNPGVALLILLLGLKILELKDKRDYYVTAELGFFVIITNFFFSQTMIAAVYLIIGAIGLTAALIRINDHDHLSSSARVRLAGSLVGQAVPVALIAFVLFPRLPGPLWGLPADAYAGRTGLDDRMTPGAISRLSKSDAVAFRVKFDAALPPTKDLYWRGPVLWHTDGHTWTAWERPQEMLSPAYVIGAKFLYEVTLEPHNRRWMFALDIPAQSPVGGLLTGDFQVLAPKPITRRIRYRAISYTDYRLRFLDQYERELALQLPAGFHPRTRALAEQWRSENPDPEDLIKRALRRFHEQSYYYTLQPGAAQGDYVDYFLFDSRQGFCEHYATAFAVLMRAAGIPARIVSGYQGGEINSFGDYMIVRQRDAHAWVEVWLNERGWTRVDPTAAVSPARIEQGVASVIQPSGAVVALGLDKNPALSALLRRLDLGWDAVNNTWNQWVLGYGKERQTELLTGFGMREVTAGNLTMSLVTAVFATTLVLMVVISCRRTSSADPALAAYRRFCRYLARRGIRRAPDEGPLDFCRRARQRLPNKRAQIERITDLYIRARYQSDDRSIPALRTEVRRLTLA
jgi:transglutaminase-like putative cysteine protease